MREMVPPCQAACPALTDVQQYVGLVALGRFSEAYASARLTNPFSNSCGYVCFHPCEQNCRRAAVDEPISIMELKRAAATFSKTERLRDGETASQKTYLQPPSLPAAQSRKKVCIIGAGPAGLTAAQDLALADFDVIVYEREKKAGGMLRQTIPSYRLPDEALDRDISEIEGAGVTIEFGRDLGKNLALDELEVKFDAVIIATGLPVSRSIPIFPSAGDSIYTALPFLKAAKAGTPLPIDRRVIVVGGGNVAIDVARTAVRLGAEEVNLVCLESREEMPAHDWEIEEAREEGVKMNCCLGPSAVATEGTAVSGLTCQAVSRVFDEDGRFDPTFVKNEFTDIAGETIIVSIGQGRETDVLGASADEIIGGRRAGVFMAGEFATGPGSAIGAVQNGHDAADAVMGYLSELDIPVEESETLGELPNRIVPLITSRNRKHGTSRPPAERGQDFQLFEPGLERTEAVREALRCMSCLSGAVVDSKKCIACLTCVRVCPFQIPKITAENIASIDSLECQACGLCASECPAAAITLCRGQEARLLDDAIIAAASAGRVEFYCANRLYSEDGVVPNEAGLVPVQCMARVNDLVIYEALRAGAKQVVLAECLEHDCAYGKEAPGGTVRELTQARVDRISNTLAGLGLDAGAVYIKE